MSIETITIGGKRYVIIPEEEYHKRHDEHGVPIISEEEMTEQDWGDVAESRRRAAEGPSIPLEEVRKRLGV